MSSSQHTCVFEFDILFEKTLFPQTAAFNYLLQKYYSLALHKIDGLVETRRKSRSLRMGEVYPEPIHG